MEKREKSDLEIQIEKEMKIIREFIIFFTIIVTFIFLLMNPFYLAFLPIAILIFIFYKEYFGKKPISPVDIKNFMSGILISVCGIIIIMVLVFFFKYYFALLLLIPYIIIGIGVTIGRKQVFIPGIISIVFFLVSFFAALHISNSKGELNIDPVCISMFILGYIIMILVIWYLFKNYKT